MTTISAKTKMNSTPLGVFAVYARFLLFYNFDFEKRNRIFNLSHGRFPTAYPAYPTSKIEKLMPPLI
jgi:hypothetical protein